MDIITIGNLPLILFIIACLIALWGLTEFFWGDPFRGVLSFIWSMSVFCVAAYLGVA